MFRELSSITFVKTFLLIYAHLYSLYNFFVFYRQKLYRKSHGKEDEKKNNTTKSQFLCFLTGHHASGAITGDRLVKRPFWEFRMTKQCTGIEHEENKKKYNRWLLYRTLRRRNTRFQHTFFEAGYCRCILLEHVKIKGSHRIKKKVRKWIAWSREIILKPSRQFFTKPFYQNAQWRIATTEPNHEDIDFLIVTGKYPISD